MFERKRRSRLAEVLRSTIVVQTKTGKTVAGILLAEYDDCIAIARARTEDPADPRRLLEIDGEVLVPHATIEFAQIGVSLDDVDARPRVRIERETG
jgi:hypothetical protein